MAVFVIFLQEG